MDDNKKFKYQVLISDEDILEEGSNFIRFYVNENEKQQLEEIALRHDYDILIRQNP